MESQLNQNSTIFIILQLILMNKEQIIQRVLKELASKKIKVVDMQSLQAVTEQLLKSNPGMKVIRILAKNVVGNQYYIQLIEYLLELKNKMSSEVREEEPPIIEINDDDISSMQRIIQCNVKKEDQQVQGKETPKPQTNENVIFKDFYIQSLNKKDRSLQDQQVHQFNAIYQKLQNEKWESLTNLFDRQTFFHENYQVLLVIITKQNVSSIELITPNNLIVKISIEHPLKEQKYFIVKINQYINMTYSILNKCQLKITLKRIIFKDERIITPLSKFIQWQKEKGIILCNLQNSQSKDYQKYALIMSSFYLCHHLDDYDWKDLQPWWYLIKTVFLNNYPSQDTQLSKQDLQCIFKIKYNFQQQEKKKYIVWLLWSIFERQFWAATKLIKLPIWLKLHSLQNYRPSFQTSKEISFLEQIYLRTLYYDKTPYKKVLLQLNLEHQNPIVQRDMVLEADKKEFEQFIQVFEQSLLTNQYIIITSFIQKYFEFKTRYIEEECPKSKSKEVKTQFFSEEIIRVLKLLQQKCSKFAQSYPGVYITKKKLKLLRQILQNLVFDYSHSQIKQIRLSNQAIVQYISISKTIYYTQHHVSRWLIESLSLNVFTFNNILKEYFQQLFFLQFHPPVFIEHLNFAKGFVAASKIQLLNLYRNTNDQDKLLQIITFVGWLDSDLKKFFREQLQIQLKRKFHNKQSLKQACFLLDISPSHYIQQRQPSNNVTTYNPNHQDRATRANQQDHPDKRQPKQVYQIIIILISQYGYRSLQSFSEESEPRFEILPLNQHENLHFIFIKNVEKESFKRNVRELQGERSRQFLPGERAVFKNKYGILLEDEGSGAGRYALALLKTLEFISKEKIIEQNIHTWAQIAKTIFEQTKGILIKYTNQYIKRHRGNGKISVKFLIGLFIVFGSYYEEQEVIKFNEDDLVWQGVQYNLAGYLFQQNCNQKEQKINLLLCIRIFRAFMCQCISITIHIAAKIIKPNIQRQTSPRIRKHLILYMWRPQYRNRIQVINVFTMLKTQMNKQFLSNTLISNIEFCKIKLLYLKGFIVRQSGHQNQEEQIESFLAELKKKCQTNNHRKDQTGIEIKEEEIRKIFFSTEYRSQLLRQFSPPNNQQYRQKFIVSAKFLNFYMNMKSINDEDIFDFFYSYLKQTINKKLSQNLQSEFKQTISVFASFTMKTFEKDILETFINNQRLHIIHLVSLIEIYFENKGMEKDYLLNLLEKMSSRYPEINLARASFINPINKLFQELQKPQKASLLSFIDQIFKNNQIKENIFTEYFKSFEMITAAQMKQIYSRKICKAFYHTHHLNTKKQEIFFSYLHKIQTDKELFANTYYQYDKPAQTEGEMLQQILQAVLKNPTNIIFLRLKYRNCFGKLVEGLKQFLSSREYTNSQINQMYGNRLDIVRYFAKSSNSPMIQEQQGSNILMLIEKEYQQCFSVNKQLDDLENIFSSIQQLESQYKRINKIRSSLIDGNKIKDIQILIDKYKGVPQISNEIKILQRLSCWKPETINNYYQLQEHYQKCKKQLIEKAQNIDKNSFNSFKANFLLLKQSQVELIFKQTPNLMNYLSYLLSIFSENNFKRIVSTFQSYFYIHSIFKGDFHESEQIKVECFSVFSKIMNSEDIEFKAALISTQSAVNFLENKNFDAKQKSTCFIITIFQCRQLFEMMDNSKIDQQMLQKFISFSNDVKNYIVTPKIAHSFKVVFGYWEKLKKCKSLKESLRIIDQFNKEQTLDKLNRSIENLSQERNIVFQKFQQANGPTTFFVNEVRYLLTESIFKIQCNNELEIIVEYFDQDIQQIIKLNFEKLTNFKQKSLLQVYNDNDQQDKKKIEILQNYRLLYSEVQSIRQIFTELISYGYDQNLITCQLKIVEGNFSAVSNKNKELTRIKYDWIVKIKEIYSHSFLLTHFIGKKLVELSSAILNKNRLYYSSLQDIVGISEERFFQIMNSQSNKCLLACADVCEPIEKIQIIANMFKLDEMDFEDDSSSKIIVISSAPEMFNCHILKENNKVLPKATQIFYCHQKSFSQQLEFFLHRAMIKSFQPHFIVGVHRLTQAVKSSFCHTLHELKKSRPNDFSRCQLIFIDNQDTNPVYQELCKPKQFNIQKRLNQQASSMPQMQHFNKILSQQIKRVTLITSAKAGLGKTYYAEKQAQRRNINIIHFPVCGVINLRSLGRRLKQIKFQGKQILLVKIGHVINKDLLNIFLESIILFRCLFSEEYIFLPGETIIHIELENIYLPESEHESYIPEEYHMLQFLAASGKEVRIKEFDPNNLDFPSLPNEHFYVYTILDLLDQHQNITQINIKFSEFNKQASPNKERCINLLQKYLIQRGISSFLLYINLMKILYFLFEAFSNNQILHPVHISKQSPTYRAEFLRMCIQNACSLLEEMFTQNTFKERNENLRNFQEMSKAVSMLIMPVYAKDAYRFAYFKADDLPMQLKTFNYYQDINMRRQFGFDFPSPQRINEIFKECSLQKLQGDKQQRQMVDILQSVANSNKEMKTDEIQKNKFLQNYKLTLDNFFKMCLLIQRERCGIPGILEGQSGVGKTALMQFLSKVIYQNILITQNIHAGINEDDLKKKVENIKRLANIYYGGKKKLWVFFDEFNTTDYLSYIKQMVIEHRFMGQKLLDNIHFFAACNPYRKIKPEVSALMRVEGGLKKRRRAEIAFLVNFPPLSMVQLMYDYQQLTSKENESYMDKMLMSLECSDNFRKLLVQTMCKLHEWITSKFDRSAVSLRDVERVKKLFVWFQQYFTNIIKAKQSKEENQMRVAALTLLFCYGLRFSQQNIRLSIMEIIEKNMDWKEKYCQTVFLKEQESLINSLKDKISQKRQVVINQAIKENIFTTFVCIMNKIPILLIGNPGSSKSLAIKIISSSFQGHRSNNQICKKFPRINMIYFQGSESCTSEGVEEVFKKAEDTISKDYLNCIYFDEIGLAESSVHNPLKVLHNRLQLHEDCKFSFIGVSNYEVDASKMSRFLVLNRSSPSEKDLKATAKLIYTQTVTFRNTRKGSSVEEIQKLGTYYYKFMQWWSNNQPEQSGFFGLRDFYNYVKYVCQNLEKDRSLRKLEKYTVEAIQVNFDGKENSILKFISLLPNENLDFGSRLIKLLKMIQQNLKDPSSRCLMEIVESDSLVPYVFSKINYRKCVIYYGSAYSKDESSEEYSYQMTFKVMSHMSKGEVILFKDPNSSLQSSLYDLFNKSFASYNGRNFCRIAVGASNSECFVHDNFNAIVFISSKKVNSLDFPFLNRFEKHYIRVNQLLSQESQSVKIAIMQWINEVIPAKTINFLHQQFFLLNSGQDSINTLLIKYEDRPFEQAVKEIKKSLLKNRTTDFEIMLKYSLKDSEVIQDMKNLIQQIRYEQRSMKDMIVYTYDQYVQLACDQNTKIRLIQERPCYKVKVGEMESEKQLKAELKYGLLQDSQMLIIINYTQDKQYIEQVLYLAKQIKEEEASEKQLIVIIRLQRYNVAEDKDPVQISHLHLYQQYFCEDINQKVERIYEAKATYQTLYQFAETQEINFLQILHIEAISNLKLRFQDNSAIERGVYFQQLRKLSENSFYQKYIKQFISEILSSSELSINYQLLHQNRVDIEQCLNIYEAVKRVISSIVKKLLTLFLRLIISKSYIKLFSRNLCEEEMKPLLHLLESCMKKDLTDLKKEIVALTLEKRNQQKESQEIYVSEQQGCFKLFDFFKKIEAETVGLQKSNNLAISQEQDRHYTYFSLALYSNRQKSRISKELFSVNELSYFILKDLISFISDVQLQPHNLLILAEFFNHKILLREVQQKIYLLLFGDRSLWRYIFSIIAILNKFSPQSIKKTQAIQLIALSKTELQMQIGRTILNLAISLCRLHNKTLLTFRVPAYLDYFKLIQEKVKAREFESFSLQVEEEFYLTNRFLQLQQKTKQEIPEDFFKQGHRSIYDKIFAFAKMQISNHSQSYEYRKFLSYNFFVSWVTYIHKSQAHEISNCIDEFSNICNEDSVFANRSASFFNIFFGDFQSFSDLEKIVGECSINNQIKRHLHPQKLLCIALTNYFFSQIERSIQRECIKNQFVLQVFYPRFQNYLFEIKAIESVNDLFKIAFIKRYLCFYVQELMNLQDPKGVQIVNNLFLQPNRHFLNDDIYRYMIDQLKIKYQMNQITQQIVKKNRCGWITFNGSNPQKIKYKQIFKNIKSVLGDNNCKYEDSLLTLFQGAKYEEKFQAIGFILKHMLNDRVFNLGAFLYYLTHILRFLSRVKRLCNLKISRFEISKKRLIELIEEQAKSQEELESLKKDFATFIQICQTISNQRNNRLISDFNMETLHVTKENKVQDFVFMNDHEPRNQSGQRLGRFVESLVRAYNHISFELIKALKLDPYEFREKAIRIDPFSIDKQSKLLHFISKENFQDIIQKYSHYTVSGQVSEVEFSFPEIQAKLLELQVHFLLQENPGSFSQPQFLGNSQHFLVEMKGLQTNQTLKQINKLADIEDYFKRVKNTKGQLFFKHLKRLHYNIEIILVFIKNLQCQPTLTLTELINAYLGHLSKQFLEEPFKTLPCSSMVDLYQFVQFLTFENLSDKLDQRYQQQGNQEDCQKFMSQLAQIRRQQNNCPSEEQFKKALYRFVGRKVVQESIGPSQSLADHLCASRHYWDQSLRRESWEQIKSERFSSGLSIKLDQLGWILKQIPYEKIDQVQHNFILPPQIRKSNKKFL